MTVRLIGLIAIAVIFVSVADASTLTTLNFTGNDYGPAVNSIPTQTSNGVSVTVTGFWANVNNSGATLTNTGTTFQSTDIAEYSGAGIGVCNQPEQSSGCPSPQHQIDNYGGLDFALFTVSAAVTLSDVFVQGFGNPTGVNGSYNDVDLSYAILSASQAASLNAGTLVFSSVNFTTMSTNFYGYNDYSLSGTGQYILIGAAVTPYYGDVSQSQATPDAFKIQTLSFTATPEPASLFLAGLSLLAISFFRRRFTAESK